MQVNKGQIDEKDVKPKRTKPFGRPTKYKGEETIKAVHEYLSTCGPTTNKGLPWYNLPSISGLCVELGVDRSTIYYWADKFPDFSHTLKVLQEEQQKQLLAGGLSGALNSTITKLVLSNNHNYSERKDITSAGKEVQSFNFNVKEPSEGHKLDTDETPSESVESSEG